MLYIMLLLNRYFVLLILGYWGMFFMKSLVEGGLRVNFWCCLVGGVVVGVGFDGIVGGCEGIVVVGFMDSEDDVVDRLVFVCWVD